jgi:hypothetical protein
MISGIRDALTAIAVGNADFALRLITETLAAARIRSASTDLPKHEKDYYGTICHHVSPVIGRVRLFQHQSPEKPLLELMRDETRGLNRALETALDPLNPLSHSRH